MNHDEIFDRFTMKPGDICIRDATGKNLSGLELKKYLEERRKKMLTISKKLAIGSIVKTKNDPSLYKILDYNYYGFDYLATKNPNPDSKYCSLFNQEDLEEIIVDADTKHL